MREKATTIAMACAETPATVSPMMSSRTGWNKVGEQWLADEAEGDAGHRDAELGGGEVVAEVAECAADREVGERYCPQQRGFRAAPAGR